MDKQGPHKRSSSWPQDAKSPANQEAEETPQFPKSAMEEYML